MHNYAYMRTTMDLPDDLARRAKLAAVNRGLSLKALVVEALTQSLDRAPARSHQGMAALPLIRSRRPGGYDLSPRKIHDILLREEAEAYEAAGRR